MKLTPEELAEAAKVCVQILGLIREHLERMANKGKIGSSRTTAQINVLGKLTLLLSYVNLVSSAEEIVLAADAYEILRKAVRGDLNATKVHFNTQGNLSILTR